MPTRLNYTNRLKLPLDKLIFNIHPDANDGPATFDAQLDLDELKPDMNDAHVFVEAWHQSTRMRFDWGTVESLLPPPESRRQLTEFEDWEHVTFRVKVTDMTHESGKILAWRKRITPHGPKDHPESDILSFRNRKLDGLIWDMEFDTTGPIVCIDPRAGDCQAIGQNPQFIASAYPEIMRRILIKAFIIDRNDGDDHDDDEENWSCIWLKDFIKPVLGIDDPLPPLEDLDVRREWIDEAVRVFARKNNLRQSWNPQLQEDR